MKIDQSVAGPHIGLARLYHRQKREEEAGAHLRSAQRLRPELAHYFELVLQQEQ